MIKRITKRDLVLAVLRGKKLTMYEVADHCRQFNIMSFQNAKDAMNSMAYSKVIIKVGEKPNPAFYNGGHPIVSVYAINEDKPRERVGGYRPSKKQKEKGYPHRGLARTNVSPDFRRKMMVKNSPLVMLYAKELQLTKEML
jgi:hypothetical protein